MTREEAIKYLQEKVESDEPVFVLRGRDVLAPAAVEHWAGLFRAVVRNMLEPKTKATGAEDVARKMRDFRDRKLPD